ncbi:ubiquinone biosynthesis protein UbiB [Novosphingobium indicum]|uniref:Ubiquinone biosynthesis protein UbiB n=1 Tax=Novosphingobium indicum TaxID=462949 RepID=A0ABQ2JJ44_9SPHN|nr:AarF/UbiB family protein [Novosphingobium indicum]GGN46205.1 ubiquinone biosynthesis protein UbiB [Novosphingobium indicum]
MMLAARFLRIGGAVFGLLIVAVYERLRGGTDNRSTLPDRLRATLERLGPTFIKVGQGLSLRRDLLPDRYIAALSKLQADARPFPQAAARHEIETGLGKPIHDLFSSFDETPLAAASIAQVHRAQMPDGREAIIKVRRPRIRSQIDRDMRALIGLLRLLCAMSSRIARFEPVRLAHEIWTNLRRETDFRLEARAVRRFADAFADWDTVHVPEVIDDLISETVLVQEFSSGRLLSDAALADSGPRYAANLVEIYLHQIFVLGFFHGDPHPGNLFFMDAGTICFHDFGLTGQLDHATRRRLALFVQAFVHQDADWMLDAAVELGLLRISGERQAIVHGLEELLTEYASLPMRQWSMADLFLRISRLGNKESVLLPHYLIVLMRALFLVEHALHTLDPAMNVLDTLIERGNAAIMALAEGPSHAALSRLRFEAGLAVYDLPGAAAAWLSEVRREGFHPALQIHLPQIERTEAGLERTGNRLALALVTLGLYIASSLLMQHSIGPRILGMPLLALVGYFLALWYTLRLSRAIARSGRL